MALINKLTAIAEAIRSKTNTTEKMTLDEMPSAIEGIQSGVNTFKYAKTLKDIFKSAVFDVEEIVIDCTNDLGNEIFSLESIFQGVKGLKKVVIKANMTKKAGNSNGFTMYNAFSQNELEVIDLSGVTALNPYNIGYLLYNSQNVREVIGEFDMSNTQNDVSNYAFLGASALEEIRIKKETLFYSISFTSCSRLSDASRQSIIDGLGDLTGQTARTITFHKDIEAKLTEEQKAQVTSKNWNLAFK